MLVNWLVTTWSQKTHKLQHKRKFLYKRREKKNKILVMLKSLMMINVKIIQVTKMSQTKHKMQGMKKNQTKRKSLVTKNILITIIMRICMETQLIIYHSCIL